MKQTMLLLALLTIALLPAASAEYSLLGASLLKYEPVPAEPGKYVTVYITLANDGNLNAENVQIELMPEYPFSIDEPAVKTLSILGSQREYVFDYKVRIAPDAVTGDNELKVRYKSDLGFWQQTTLSLAIQSGDATLSVNSAVLDPIVVAPGENADLVITLENMADDLLKDITISLDLFSETTATATSVSVDDPPFAPIGSTNEKKIFQILPGEKKTLTFPLQAYTSASPGLYKVPITISYYDNVGTAYELTQLIGLSVGSTPELSVVVDSTTLQNAAVTGEVTIKVVNKGLSDVKFLNVHLLDSDVYEIVSASDEVYLGNLDSDDYDTASFNLRLLQPQKYIDVPVEITYRDANNNAYTEQATVQVRLFSNEELGIKKSYTGMIIFILIVLLVIGYIVYRRAKKKKK